MIWDSLPTVLAHQGGWDEMLMVAGPLLLLWLVLRAANRRAQEKAAEHDGPDGVSPDD